MIRPSAERLLWVCGALSLIVGIATTIGVFVGMPGLKDRLTRRLGDIRRLRELECEFAGFEAARAVFDQLSVGRPPALETLLRGSPLELKRPEIRDLESEPLNGWVLRRQEVSFTEASIGGVMEFVRLAELQRPPWRLVRCEIRASPRLQGTGHVVLVFEALEKPE